MTHTDQLRRALRAYDLAGPETPERADAVAAVLSAAHNRCAAQQETSWVACADREPGPDRHDLIDSALLLALVFFILYTLDNARPF